MTNRVTETLGDAAATLKEKTASTLDVVEGAVGDASAKIKETAGTARQAAGDAYDVAADKAAEGYASAKGAISSAAARTSDSLDANPLVALLGGLAAGLIAGALLPRSEKEAQYLGSIGERVAAAAKAAAGAARSEGERKLGELGISRDNAKDQVGTFLSLLGEAAKAAGSAGAGAAKSAAKAD